ncbi:hypothetical protein NIES2119_31460 [[Phormidium ambiguum] IAM M-71]|uniref:Uncharacterized protein n=1 Tax=[Phormidium ambiguum] IAM M-71 TaxID=454136 RepID=A0A1U7I2E6_9CYAN|nr:hypothetical protein [Phormidium ambiguum]OKH30189.1 hypothetical protein NIES2119_31460 [Phormidium ambiguum IAM M-71]
MKQPNKSRLKIQKLKRLASLAKKKALRKKITRRALKLMRDRPWRFIADRAPKASIDGLMRAIELKERSVV